MFRVCIYQGAHLKAIAVVYVRLTNSLITTIYEGRGSMLVAHQSNFNHLNNITFKLLFSYHPKVSDFACVANLHVSRRADKH